MLNNIHVSQPEQYTISNLCVLVCLADDEMKLAPAMLNGFLL